MSSVMTSGRARSSGVFGGPSGIDRWLGHPLAYCATAAILFGLFSFTFVADPQRVAPTKDPAYYTWRTEALISEDPATLLDIEGAFDMFAGGYRVAASVLGGFLRHVAGVSSLTTTIILMVAIPVLTSLLLAGFAYQQRRDPLIWHSVAFATAGLYLTPPFVGYLDNILCLFFLAAALPFLGPSRDRWPPRIALFLFLVLTGFTHPTTLVIFCLTLGLMSAARLLSRKLDLRSVIRDDAAMLLTAFLAAVATYAIWTIGIWGKSASLTEAALPPPYDSAFFLARLTDWVASMNPLLNGPLFAIGLVGLLVSGRRAAEDDLARVSILWLAPLAGLFGFLGGLTYPYYRFFNTTLAWVLLIGVGAYFVLRWLLDRAQQGAAMRLTAVAGVILVGGIFAYNFVTGFRASGWNKATGGWLSAEERADLDALRAELASENEDRPVVFVIDDVPSPQIWGFTKLAGNTSRYGLPHGQIDRGYLYLGSVENFFEDEPTKADETTYDRLSPALLDDARHGILKGEGEPITVVARIFNPSGANADVAAGEAPPPQPPGEQELWVVHDGRVEVAGSGGTSAPAQPAPDGGIVHLLRVIAGLAVLVLPGVITLRWLMPEAGVAEALGMTPALSLSELTALGIGVLALTRSPFSAAQAWIAVAVAIVVGGLLLALASSRGPAPLRSLQPSER